MIDYLSNFKLTLFTSLCPLQYPVMETEHKNVFEPQPMPDPGKHKELTGPMFKIDRSVRYEII